MNLNIVKGDITKVHSGAIVNAANVKMRGGGGVDGAIHQAAGPGLLSYESWMYPYGLSGVACPVVTPAFDLPAKWLIHVAGPDVRELDEKIEHGWTFSDNKLWLAYARTLVLAGLIGAEVVTFPSLSTGIFGFPLARAVPIALDALRTAADRAPSVHTTAIVAFDDETYDAFQAGL